MSTEPVSTSADSPEPPAARRVRQERNFHGDTFVDEYAWLADKESPETIAFLEAENAYTEAMTAGQEGLREAIFGEIKARTKETDLSVPSRKGGWWYYVRTIEGQQYPVFFHRRRGRNRRGLNLRQQAGCDDDCGHAKTGGAHLFCSRQRFCTISLPGSKQPRRGACASWRFPRFSSILLNQYVAMNTIRLVILYGTWLPI